MGRYSLSWRLTSAAAALRSHSRSGYPVPDSHGTIKRACRLPRRDQGATPRRPPPWRAGHRSHSVTALLLSRKSCLHWSWSSSLALIAPAATTIVASRLPLARAGCTIKRATEAVSLKRPRSVLATYSHCSARRKVWRRRLCKAGRR
jgi:hypothetical protein